VKEPQDTPRLSNKELAELASLGKQVTAPAETVLFKEGDPGDALFIVQEGIVEVNAAEGRLTTIYAGEMFGEMAVIDGLPRSATARSLVESKLLRIDAESFPEICVAHFSLASHILKILSGRVRELNRIAMSDALTGVRTKGQYLDLSQRELMRAKRDERTTSAIVLDIDAFHRINDRFGYHVGDRVLQRVAEIIMKVVRSSDVVGRLGGEEFAITLPDTPRVFANLVALRLVETIRSTKFSDLEDEHITISAGVSTTSDESIVEFAELLKLADTAMIAAKDGGRDRSFSWDGEHAQPITDRSIIVFA